MQTAIFDLGNVIVFFSFPKMIAQISACTGLTPAQIHHFFIDKNLRADYEAGQVTSQQLYDAFRTLSPRSFSKEKLFLAASDIFTPNTSLFPLLETLKKQGTRLLLLSNTSEAHFDFIFPRTPILDLFDDYILSYKVKASKPDPKIFQTALKKARCPPAECFYTDDIPEYIAAAKTHGIDAELFTDVPQLKKHLASRGFSSI
jgi:putative hydrolase of the HAD superfamily